MGNESLRGGCGIFLLERDTVEYVDEPGSVGVALERRLKGMWSTLDGGLLSLLECESVRSCL